MPDTKVNIMLSHQFSGPSIRTLEVSRVPVTGEFIFVSEAAVYRVQRVVHVVAPPVDALVEVTNAQL